MGAVIKFRAKLTPYDVEMATSFGRPLREYAERLATVQLETRLWERDRCGTHAELKKPRKPEKFR